MLRWRELGLHLTRPWRVVLAGAPNVGKSSLINRLAGYERAIVSPHPGTTRDVVTMTTAIAGWPVELADTAGLRETADALESAGVALAAGAAEAADLVVVVADAREIAVEATASGVESILGPVARQARILRVYNKVDLLQPAVRQWPAPTGGIATSAVTGEGLAALMETIARTLVPVVPAAGQAVPFTQEQAARLETAQIAVVRREALAAEVALRGLVAGDAS
jgi:tRNA modification GTPase